MFLFLLSYLWLLLEVWGIVEISLEVCVSGFSVLRVTEEESIYFYFEGYFIVVWLEFFKNKSISDCFFRVGSVGARGGLSI